MTENRSSFSFKLTPEQQQRLLEELRRGNYEPFSAPYVLAGGRTPHCTIALYTSGKLLVQGRDAADVVAFTIEPLVLQSASLGYEDTLNPDGIRPHLGVDESGKGDFFGPLVAAGVYLDAHAAKKMLELGVKDSKRIASDARIETLANAIRAIAKWDVVAIGNEKYNELQKKMRTVNNLLGWMHARVIENMLAKAPDCPTAISDQFGNKRIVQNALMERGRNIELIQRHKAESDLAVAAASILARDEFVRRLEALGKHYGVDFPKGASAAVRAAAVELIRKHGPAALPKVAKIHFRTSQQVLAEAAA